MSPSLSVTGLATSGPDLEMLLGPRRQDLVKVIPVTIIYALIFVTGVVGNVSTCVVIARNHYMHTATNYCLFNLAVSDLMMLLLGLPQETYTFWSAYPWIFGETFCVLRTLAAETSTYASILTITTFTVERYVAICHPVKARATQTSLQRAIKLIAVIWIVSALCSIPIVVQYGIVHVQDSEGRDVADSATCNIAPDRYLPHAFEASTFLFFIIPLTVIAILYGLIGLTIRRSTSLTRAGSDASSRGGPVGIGNSCRNSAEQRSLQHLQTRARLAVIKMLVAVVVVFFICWAPFHTQRLISIYTDQSRSLSPPSTTTSAIDLLTPDNSLLNFVTVGALPQDLLPYSQLVSAETDHVPARSPPVSAGGSAVVTVGAGGWSLPSDVVQAVLFYLSGIFYYISAVVNPILYNIMSLKFRRAFRTTLCRTGCCCGGGDDDRRRRRNGNISCSRSNNNNNKSGRCFRCCRCFNGGDDVQSERRGDLKKSGHNGRGHRVPTAYRFSGHGQVEMIPVDGSGRDRKSCDPRDRASTQPPSELEPGRPSYSGSGLKLPPECRSIPTASLRSHHHRHQHHHHHLIQQPQQQQQQQVPVNVGGRQQRSGNAAGGLSLYSRSDSSSSGCRCVYASAAADIVPGVAETNSNHNRSHASTATPPSRRHQFTSSSAGVPAALQTAAPDGRTRSVSYLGGPSHLQSGPQSGIGPNQVAASGSFAAAATRGTPTTESQSLLAVIIGRVWQSNSSGSRSQQRTTSSSGTTTRQSNSDAMMRRSQSSAALQRVSSVTGPVVGYRWNHELRANRSTV